MTVAATTPETLRQLLNVLLQYQKSAWDSCLPGIAPSARAYATYSVLSVYYWKPVTERGIKAWLTPSEPSVSTRREGLYLPPLERNPEFVPVLQVECTRNEEWADVKLMVMMVRSVNEEETCCINRNEVEVGENKTSVNEDKPRIVGLGFRMEKGTGRHSFHHAQFVRGFEHGPSVECPSWLPEKQPSFPLTAKCPVTLVLCLLLTLYGTKCLRFFTGQRVFRLEQYIEELKDWISW